MLCPCLATVWQEVQQPTVVDPASFLVWAEEAFHLWVSEWASIYDSDSSSADMIHNIHDTHFLVNLVDHDFVRLVSGRGECQMIPELMRVAVVVFLSRSMRLLRSDGAKLLIYLAPGRVPARRACR